MRPLKRKSNASSEQGNAPRATRTRKQQISQSENARESAQASTVAVSMQQERKKSPKGFLDLPGELRNRIYELALIRPKITIVSAPEDRLVTFGDVHTLPDYCWRQWKGVQPLSRPVRSRSRWVVYPMQHVRDYERSVLAAGIKAFPASYELKKVDEVEFIDGVNLSLLLVNKQVHQEAAQLFYENNTFSLELRWEDTCLGSLAFFWDLSQACEWLRSIHLHLALPPPFSYTQPYPFSVNGISKTDYSPPPSFKDLSKAIRKLRLTHFGLTIHGSPPRFRTVRPWAAEMMKLGRFDTSYLEVRCSPSHLGESPAIVIPDVVHFCKVLQLKWISDRTPIISVGAAKLYALAANVSDPVLLRVRAGSPSLQFTSIDRVPGYESHDIGDWESRQEEVFDPNFWSPF